MVLAGRGYTTSDQAWHLAVSPVGFDGKVVGQKLDDSAAGATGQTVAYLTFQAWDANGNARWSKKFFPTTNTKAYALAGDGASVVASARLLTSDASGTGDRFALVRFDAAGAVVGDGRVGVDDSTAGRTWRLRRMGRCWLGCVGLVGTPGRCGWRLLSSTWIVVRRGCV